MIPVIYFRKFLETEEEYQICEKYFKVFQNRMEIPKNSLVISRYSCLPYYLELENDLKCINARLINSYEQHRFIANILNWSSSKENQGGLLGKLTPYTWTQWADIPEGSYVVKGITNSKKHQWKSHMFAETKSKIPDVVRRLLDDDLIREQGIVVRQYHPLRVLDYGINDLPITNEWRTFWCVKNGIPYLLASGFYWAAFPELAKHVSFSEQAYQVANQAANLLASYTKFFVLDVAETKDGNWIVIEVNDGQMSGTSMIDTNELYSNFRKLFSNIEEE